jgi:hypothetical protein
MAYYTSAIQTEVINPVYNQSKYRSEFRLDTDMLYTPNMRVLNLGVLGTSTSFSDNRAYNLLTGVGGVIKNIFLYDDKQVLDQVLNYRDYGAFKNFNATNSDNQDVKKNLKKHGLGFVYDTDTFTPATAIIRSLIKQYNPINGGHIPTDSEDTSPTGYLDLRDVFPLLKSIEFLSTSIFKNLKVVIEYDVNNVLSITTGTDATKPSATTVPILVVDKVVDEEYVSKWLSAFKGITWNCMEMEAVQLPSITPPASGVQSIKYRLNGFTDKSLGVLLLQKKPSVLSNDYLNNGSVSLINETIQVSVNGSNILPDDGVVAPNQRLALLTDTFGNCNAFSGCNMTGFINCSQSVENFASRVGQLDYFGCAVGKKISNLDITVSRKYTAGIDARYKQSIELQFWGSVMKSIVVGKDNSYQVIYV